MGKLRAPNARFGPRKPKPRRFYRGLLMPPLDHPAGAAIEAQELPTSPRSRRMALWVVVAAGVVVLSALVSLGLSGRRKHQHAPTEPCLAGTHEKASARRPDPVANPTK